MGIFKEITENQCVNERHPFVKVDNIYLQAYTCCMLGKLVRCAVQLHTKKAGSQPCKQPFAGVLLTWLPRV